MSHKIDISDKTYDALKEYCTLNGLKMGQFVDKLLYEGLMVEKYGDTPFTNYKKPVSEPPKPVEIQVIEAKEVKPEEEKKDFNELYKDIAESEWFKKAYVGKSITTDEEPQNKPETIKRRLK